jgi:hypothetical protein
MAADPLDALRLALMQDVLPVGMAVVERARRGGPREVLAAFDGSSDDPLGQLREEGEPAASQLRDNLDRLQPGLGNPVMKVEVHDVPIEPVTVAVQTPSTAPASDLPPDAADPAELQATLARIAAHLELLEQRLGLGSAAGEAPGGP